MHFPGALPPGGALPIRVVAAELGVSAHTLRYYEDLGLVRVPRDAAGHRSYDTAALGRLEFLVRMRAAGVGIGDLRRYVDLVEQGPETMPTRLEMLHEHRASIRHRIEALRRALDLTEYKIRAYGGTLDDTPTPTPAHSGPHTQESP